MAIQLRNPNYDNVVNAMAQTNNANGLSSNSYTPTYVTPQRPDESMVLEMLNKQAQDNSPYKGSPAVPGSYLDKLSSVESGGSYTAENASSGAYGRYQFLKSTATPYLEKRNMNWQDFKANPKLQDSIYKEYEDNNRRGLTNAGIEPTDRNMYMAHNLGIGSAVNYLSKGISPNQRYLLANNVSSMDEWYKKLGNRF